MHECPDCGQACYCGGDIDDCLHAQAQAQIAELEAEVARLRRLLNKPCHAQSTELEGTE